jgi:SAM-dependent methyltransferase
MKDHCESVRWTVNSNPVNNFERYSFFYDLLYRDKDYVAEADYVARRLLNWTTQARAILELGSGTGRHGRLLAQMGFDVHGIERSPQMLSLARAAGDLSPHKRGSFTCELGDICTINLGRTFDAVISLFHVMSYQTTNQALRSAFRVAADHLEPEGVFLFDVWHGPAVLFQGPSNRVKEGADEHFRVRRAAYPELDTKSQTVKVAYEMECEDRISGHVTHFSEEHIMRYLFPEEVSLLGEDCGFRCVVTEEFLTGEPPSPSTWSVTYLLQKGAC